MLLEVTEEISPDECMPLPVEAVEVVRVFGIVLVRLCRGIATLPPPRLLLELLLLGWMLILDAVLLESLRRLL